MSFSRFCVDVCLVVISIYGNAVTSWQKRTELDAGFGEGFGFGDLILLPGGNRKRVYSKANESQIIYMRQ